jgi:hypothetical protein
MNTNDPLPTFMDCLQVELSNSVEAVLRHLAIPYSPGDARNSLRLLSDHMKQNNCTNQLKGQYFSREWLVKVKAMLNLHHHRNNEFLWGELQDAMVNAISILNAIDLMTGMSVVICLLSNFADLGVISKASTLNGMYESLPKPHRKVFFKGSTITLQPFISQSVSYANCFFFMIDFLFLILFSLSTCCIFII